MLKLSNSQINMFLGWILCFWFSELDIRVLGNTPASIIVPKTSALANTFRKKVLNLKSHDEVSPLIFLI